MLWHALGYVQCLDHAEDVHHRVCNVWIKCKCMYLYSYIICRYVYLHVYLFKYMHISKYQLEQIYNIYTYIYNIDWYQSKTWQGGDPIPFLLLPFNSPTKQLLDWFIPPYPGELRFSDPLRQCRRGPLKAAPTQMGRWTLATNEKRTQHPTHTGWNLPTAFHCLAIESTWEGLPFRSVFT